MMRAALSTVTARSYSPRCRVRRPRVPGLQFHAPGGERTFTGQKFQVHGVGTIRRRRRGTVSYSFLLSTGFTFAGTGTAAVTPKGGFRRGDHAVAWDRRLRGDRGQGAKDRRKFSVTIAAASPIVSARLRADFGAVEDEGEGHAGGDVAARRRTRARPPRGARRHEHDVAYWHGGCGSGSRARCSAATRSGIHREGSLRLPAAGLRESRSARYPMVLS